MNRFAVARHIRRTTDRGHPWIYSKAGKPTFEPGTIATAFDEEGDVCVCWVDPSSPIAARVLFTSQQMDRIHDAHWVAARAQAAVMLRQASGLFQRTDAIRLIHGEADRMPGLVVDRYADVLVVTFDGPAAHLFWEPRLDDVLRGFADATLSHHFAQIVNRGARGQHKLSSQHVRIHEAGALFDVDVGRGQKTGFFLDQRANRMLIGKHARGQRVLNLCSYSGGFSIHALLGGATHVTSVDLAPEASAASEAHAALNIGTPEAQTRHESITADVFAFLEDAARKRRTWDMVITDPPSFAHSESAKPGALSAYTRLARLGLSVTKPGGMYVAASCSSHVSESDFREAVAAGATQADTELRTIIRSGADADHPTLPAFPEGRYLKFLLSMRS